MVTKIKAGLKWLLTFGARLLGWRLLTKEQTQVFLQPYLVEFAPAHHLNLPQVYDLIEDSRLVFRQKEAHANPAAVWHLSEPATCASVIPNGLVAFDNTIPCTDYWNYHSLYDRLRPRRRQRVDVDTVIAPFGHQQDGVTFGGYYDFIYLVAAKLCRIQQTLPNASFAGMAIAYPLFNTPYEAEMLAHLGFAPDRIFDSRRYDVRARRYLLGNGGDWFYPNLADVRAITERLAPLISSAHRPANQRLYISRTGRRRVRNEAELVAMLLRYGFVFVEDKPRTLAEQLTLYHNASFIIGPHGSSFSNINWCRPGTYLHELCSVNYAPDFFLYLAQVRKLAYSVSLHGQVVQQPILKSLTEDITVSVPSVERTLNELLLQQAQ